MANIDQYNNAFVEVFGVNASTLNDDFSKESVDCLLYTSDAADE